MTNRFGLWQIALLLMLTSHLAQAANTLNVGERLTSDEYLSSDNGKYRFYLQGDGNLVLRDWATRESLWSSGTHGKGGVRLSLQSDGNLVLRTAQGSAVWSSRTSRTNGERFVMQDDAALVLYSGNGESLWSTGTSVGSSGGDGDTGSDELVRVLENIRALNGTIVLDWDSTIDIDSDFTVGRTAPRWLDAFAEANVDAWLVTGNGRDESIEATVLGVVKTANRSYWTNLLRNKAYYGESTGNKEDKYELIIGSRAPWQFMIADDAGANIDDFETVTNGLGYLYEPNSGYATYDEMSEHLPRFLQQLEQNEGSSNAGGSSDGIQHIATTEVWDSNGQNVRIDRPSGTRAGDLQVLVLHRTDDHLPFEVSGWKRAAECYKEDNGYQCLTVADCTSESGRFCDRFENRYRGRDLAQVIVYKTAGSNEPGSYSFNLNKDSDGKPGWAFMTTLRGADTSNPVRDSAHRGCDKNADSLFPSVSGRKGDMVLLSQSFDDAVSNSRFNAPDNTTTFGYVSNSDEAGFLFGGILGRDGETGDMKTHGAGASSCKDALVSLTIRAK
ncbi:hypothetical protein [Allohahella marinimesophila]|uniref:Bulb-type lectin domain-containing protein n=1 Tax=Allohahella marinimesophila TaxID=1054972 RepID=A0ABP7NGL3_9GAMM